MELIATEASKHSLSPCAQKNQTIPQRIQYEHQKIMLPHPTILGKDFPKNAAILRL